MLGASDLASMRTINTSKPLQYLAYNHDGTEVAASDNSVSVFVWNTATQALANSDNSFMNGIYALRYDQADALLVASQLGPSESLAVFSLFNNTSGGGFSIGEFEFGDAIAIHPDGSEGAAPTRHGTIAIWNRSNSLTPRVEFSVAAWPDVLDYNPDGSVLASADEDCQARIRNSQNGEEIGSFQWCSTLPSSKPVLAFSPDGRTLAVGAGQGEILLWDIPSQSFVRELALPSTPILAIAFSPEGNRLGVLQSNGLVEIWDISQ